MSTYVDQVLGPATNSENPEFFAQIAEIEKQIHKTRKRKKGKGKKRLKKMEKKLWALEEDLRKQKKKKANKGKWKKKSQQQIRKLEQERQQRDLWLHDAMTAALINLMGSATVSVNWLPSSQNHSAIPLPPPRDTLKK